jgi:antitoxin HigA-1
MDKLPSIHPGEVLREEFLLPMGITPYRLAKSIRVPQTRVAEIVHERRGITADTALRLASFFGTTAEFWTNLQTFYELEQARRAIGEELEQIPRAVA